MNMRRRGSAASQLVGVIVGGVMGLAIGYYLLNYFGGPSFNWLKIPLPGIPHTQPGAELPEAAHDQTEKTAPAGRPANVPGQPSPDQPAMPTEPAPPSEPVAQYPPDYVGPRRLDLYDAADLAEALVRANELAGGAGAGAAASGPPPALSAESYTAWCDVAEVIALLSPDEPEKNISPRRDALRRLALRIATAENVREIERLTPGRLDNPPRPEAGILLVGQVEEIKPSGKLKVLQISAPSGSRQTKVLSPRGSIAGRGDLVLVLGAVVAEPGQNVIGYTGTEPQAVWAGLIVKLPD